MKPVYKRENLKLTAFDTEDVITTSGDVPDTPIDTPTTVLTENNYRAFGSFSQAPGSWF